MRLRGMVWGMVALLVGCTGPAFAEEGIVAVSAGIASCVENLIQAYAVQGGKPLTLVRESTGTIARQMDQGAPYDVLVAADPEWPQWLAERGKLKAAAPCARGQMVVWVASGKPPRLEDLGKIVLACPDPESTSTGNWLGSSSRTASFGMRASETAGSWWWPTRSRESWPSRAARPRLP